MTTNEPMENARVQGEAREAAVHRTSRGPAARAIEDAMKTYLAAEAEHELAKGRTDATHPSPPSSRARDTDD